jgi:hypothetical protein
MIQHCQSELKRCGYAVVKFNGKWLCQFCFNRAVVEYLKSQAAPERVKGLKAELAERKNCANCRHISVAYICETPHCTLGEKLYKLKRQPARGKEQNR